MWIMVSSFPPMCCTIDRTIPLLQLPTKVHHKYIKYMTTAAMPFLAKVFVFLVCMRCVAKVANTLQKQRSRQNKKDFLLGNWCALVECTNIISLSLLGGRRMLPSTVLKLPINIEFRRIWGAFFEFSVNSLFGELEKATFRNDQYLWPSMRKLETILKQKLASVSLLIT